MNKHLIQFKTYLLVTALLLSACAGNKKMAADNSGEWISIWDGESFEGWRASENPGSFSIEDGKIVVNGPRAHLFYEGPVAGADFKNFEFKAEIFTYPKANSGIFFHTRSQQRGWPQQGYEAQVNATHSDPIKTGSLYAVENVMHDAPHEDKEWFTYHITVNGKEITFRVDGEVVMEYTEPENVEGTKRLSSGTIALQAHDPNSQIYYRNLQVRVLPE